MIPDYDLDDYSPDPEPTAYYCPGCGYVGTELGQRADNNHTQHVEQADEPDDEFERCRYCDGHDACADFGCAFDMGLGDLVETDL